VYLVYGGIILVTHGNIFEALLETIVLWEKQTTSLSYSFIRHHGKKAKRYTHFSRSNDPACGSMDAGITEWRDDK